MIIHFYVDVDECARNLDSCDNNAQCVNLPGSFECRCPSGFKGDGSSCTGKATVYLYITCFICFSAPAVEIYVDLFYAFYSCFVWWHSSVYTNIYLFISHYVVMDNCSYFIIIFYYYILLSYFHYHIKSFRHQWMPGKAMWRQCYMWK